jgi:hypothetical protein
LLPPILRRRIIVRKTSRAATRVALVERLMRAAELQLHGEQRLASAAYEPTESDGNSRAIALLARTIRELTGLDERNGSRSAKPKQPSICCSSGCALANGRGR